MKYNGHRRIMGLGRDEAVLWLKNAVIIVLTVVMLAASVMLQVSADIKNAGLFCKGIEVNDIDLYGMSLSEAMDAVTKSVSEYLGSVKLPIDANGKEYVIAADEFVEADIESTVTFAYETSNAVVGTEHDEGKFYTAYYIDADRLREILERISDETYVAPVEPEAEFNESSRSFNYKEGKNGSELDLESAETAVTAMFENGDYTKIHLKYNAVQPQATIDELKENTGLVAEYTSITTDSYNRNKNIELMCSYVNGYVLGAGDVISINDIVGERTEEKGFLPAPAIMDGKRTENDIGGGICQLSGTLYNAALLANMQVVERWPHSWPSDYLEIGLDSTLDWNSEKDLKLRNTSSSNMYFSAWLEHDDLSSSNVLHVAIYGQPFPEGVTVKVYSEVTETIKPASAKRTYTTNLDSGEIRVEVAERMGYRARVWREFYCNGELLDTEIVSRSYYAPIRGEVLIGKAKNPEPTEPDEPEIPDEPEEPNEPEEPEEPEEPYEP